MKNTIFALALLGGLACQTTATAQTEDPQPRTDGVEAQTRLWDAMRSGKWRDALLAYNQIEEPTQRHVFLAAQAHYNLGELEKSSQTLGVLLEGNEDHLQALYMLARIRAKQGRMDDARTLLRSSARLGQSVLRDLYTDENSKLFAELLRDSDFLVAIMRDSQGYTNPSIDGHDPFSPPVGTYPTSGAKTRKVKKKQDAKITALETRITTLLNEFRSLSRDPSPDIDLLLLKLAELRTVLSQYTDYAELHGDSLSQTLQRFRSEFDELKGVLQPLQLQLYVADGNQHLRVMARALGDEDYKGVLARFGRLKELCEQMDAEAGSVFHANARMLLVRGKGLADRATLELRASQLILEITGVVLAPSPERNTAVINDRIYEEGDSILDPGTDEEVGLEILRISNRSVTFRLENLTFVRALKGR